MRKTSYLLTNPPQTKGPLINELDERRGIRQHTAVRAGTKELVFFEE